MSEFTFRSARPDDWKIIGDLHAASWRSAYCGILPDHYLQNEAINDRRSHWQKLLSKTKGQSIIELAYDGQRLAGFAAVIYGPDAQADATLDNLHVTEDLRGGGLGRRLFGRVVEQLIASKATSLCLWVFDENVRAVQFYLPLGGRETADGFDPMHGANAPHTQISWYDLDRLLVACKGGEET
jgi:GNAT superfamily N-acetyltransferase